MAITSNPRPTGSDVLVKVVASSINGSDLALRHSRGLMSLAMSGSRPGFDVAGQIVGCGDAVTAFEVGDEVLGLLDHDGGGQSEFVVMPQRRLGRAPSTMSLVDAAAIPLAGLTALQALRTRGRLRPGERVLINGAAGGIGSFAVQLAKIFGAHVTAVTSNARHDYLAGLGADRTVNRDENALLAGTDSFDLILDAPAVWRLKDVRAALGAGGRLVTTRPITTDIVRMVRKPWRSSSQPRVAAVTTAASSQDLDFLTRLVEQGRLVVPIDRTYPLAEARSAYEYAEQGTLRGKIVLTL